MRPTPKELSALLTAAGAGKLAGPLKKLALPAVEITPAETPEAKIPIGASKFGGQPDMPKATAWPTSEAGPLNFLAQINLRDLAEHDPAASLPRSGLLLFFYRMLDGPWGFAPEDRDGFHVMWVPDPATLKRTPPPKKKDAEGQAMTFQSCTLAFRTCASLPSPDAIPDHDGGPPEKAWRTFVEDNPELCATLWGEQGSDTTCLNQMFGHAYTVQNPAILTEAAAVTMGLNLGGEVDLTDEEEATLEKAESDQDNWVVLLQLDTDDRPGWMWGDVGMLYFLIRKDALARCEFDKAWCILQCG